LRLFSRAGERHVWPRLEQTGRFRPASSRILPSPVNADRGRGPGACTCPTLPAKCQWARRAPRPAAAGSGAGPCPAGRWKARLRRLTGRPGVVQRHGRAKLGRPGRLLVPPSQQRLSEATAGRPVRSCDLDGQVQPAAALMAVGFGSLPYHNLTAQTLQLAPVPVPGPATGIGRVQPQKALLLGLVRTRLDWAARAASVSRP
jgi:hypothetical protein